MPGRWTLRGKEDKFGALATMLRAVLLVLLPLQDPRSARGHPLHMRLPPAPCKVSPGWSEGAAEVGG